MGDFQISLHTGAVTKDLETSTVPHNQAHTVSFQVLTRQNLLKCPTTTTTSRIIKVSTSYHMKNEETREIEKKTFIPSFIIAGASQARSALESVVEEPVLVSQSLHALTHYTYST